jgi:pimeloyl-ACP methyl ester carboxylesterase
MKPGAWRLERRGEPTLIGDRYGAADAPAILLAHGGGQTRHAWGGTAAALAEQGWQAVAVDLRGHGESDWVTDGDYRLDSFARDLLDAADGFAAPPALVGASLGGLSGLIAQGEMVPAGRRGFSALVLVDVTPRVDPEGVRRIRGFMNQHLEHGFASLDEAAQIIADYLPHRPPPKSLAGLRKNLRLGEDGRFRWHWDPRFVADRERSFRNEDAERLLAAAAKISVPLLLVRGGRSEVVTDATATELQSLVPHARYADVPGAGHMVAGDANDPFTEAVTEFLLPLRAAVGARHVGATRSREVSGS